MQKFMVFCLLVSFLVFSVSATGSEYVSRDTFWNWAAGSNGVIKQVINFVGGLGTCSKSDDTYHHASSYFKEGNVDGEVRYRCICDLCGDAFTAYASDLQQSYDAQVAELPATGVTSAGRLIWRPTLDCMSCSDNTDNLFEAEYNGGRQSFIPYKLSQVSYSDMYGFSFNKSDVYPTFSYSTRFLLPVSGSYSLTSNICFVYSAVGEDGTSLNGQINDIASSFAYFSAGDYIPYSSPSISASSSIVSSFRVVVYLPVYEVIPDFASGDIYNINSRPTSITGDYGIIGDNGQITKVEGNTIVNETNNTVYNPVTGDTSNITDWSYDYSTRTYTVTLDNGTTQTITYGDENVTIIEGDTTYNVYYLVDGSGSEDPGPDVPSTCDHTWTETSRTEPTCSTPGKVTSTCSKCSQTKTETIPATGHSWVVDRTVQTEYDEEGNLLQQGYTIYSCSVCGEQYKDMEGTGPPGGEEEKSIWEKIGDFFGTIGGGFIDIIGAFFGKILDALIALAEMLMGKLKTVVETVLSIFDELPALFGGFLDFLAAIFPFLPPEITTILTFGVIAITFIGILKAVRR